MAKQAAPASGQMPGQSTIDDEKAHLADWRKRRQRAEAPWTGIALSGGGIRSATYCLGVLQGLAAKDLLKQFDYMSTVSGGGFIGSSLRWWWCGKHGLTDNNGKVEFGTGPKDFPYGSEDPDPDRRVSTDSDTQHKVLTFLRNHGDYLAPGNGINIFSGLGVVIRAVLLNLLVWIPFTALLAWLAWLVPDDWVTPLFAWLPNDGSPLPAGVIPARWSTTYANAMNLRPVHMLPGLFALFLWLALLLIAIFVAGSVIYSLQTWRARDVEFVGWAPNQWVRMAGGVTLFIAGGVVIWLFDTPYLQSPAFAVGLFGAAIFFKAVIVLVGKKDMSQGYLLRRFFVRMVGRWSKYAFFVLVIGVIPVAFKLAFTVSTKPGVTGLFAVAIGVASGLWGHYQTLKKVVPGLAASILLPVGSALFLFGVLLLGYEIAMILVDPEIVTAKLVEHQFVYSNLGATRDIIRLVIACSFAVAILTGYFVNTNHVGLNRYYRDQLMEAYMPRASGIDEGEITRTPVAERLGLSELWKVSTTGPYPLINTNVVLVNDDDRTYRVRGGDSYLLSPFFCGSTATGWYPSSDEASKAITLASAMAASGAAANPNAGYVGTGPTRGRLLSTVMTLLNVRLGYWIANPVNTAYQGMIKPNHFIPGAFYALFKDGFKRDSDFLELTDGGHFDNLGVYELARRKCRLIVVVDGEADKETSYSALISVQRRIEEDFGATIILTKGKGPELLVPRLEMAYPSNAKMAKQPYFVATIRYNDGTEGAIIYMKATVIDEL